jgi:hypothetical protein
MARLAARTQNQADQAGRPLADLITTGATSRWDRRRWDQPRAAHRGPRLALASGSGSGACRESHREPHDQSQE